MAPVRCKSSPRTFGRLTGTAGRAQVSFYPQLFENYRRQSVIGAPPLLPCNARRSDTVWQVVTTLPPPC